MDFLDTPDMDFLDKSDMDFLDTVYSSMAFLTAVNRIKGFKLF